VPGAILWRGRLARKRQRQASPRSLAEGAEGSGFPRAGQAEGASACAERPRLKAEGLPAAWASGLLTLGPRDGQSEPKVGLVGGQAPTADCGSLKCYKTRSRARFGRPLTGLFQEGNSKRRLRNK